MPKKKNVSTNQQKDLAQHKIFLVKQVKGRVYSNEQGGQYDLWKDLYKCHFGYDRIYIGDSMQFFNCCR